MRGMGGYFNDNSRFMIFCQRQHQAATVDSAVVAPVEVFGGANGLNASKMIGANYNYRTER